MYDQGGVKLVNLINSAAVAGTGNSQPLPRGPTTYQASCVTTSTGASAVIAGAATVQVSNDNITWLALGTLTSTGSGTSSPDGFASLAPWGYARAVITTLTTGIAAAMTVQLGA